ncbi:Rho GTPase-activating protein 18/28/40 [Mytilus galloprovincialis]|uniref:Rho GTPase-activating protein 18/28/40 n=1 Tax=Mytilus galloprovincialis TaxID=29158 RepID=A0A8B6BDD0_MYTGA|nr:Rho GTPase-activating protein 18/28/40 [Mytilus galloprovincialis]
MARPSSNLYDDYWKEFHDIENNQDDDGEEDLHSKTPDEGEQEAAWLNEAGYGFVVNALHDGKDLSEDDIEALTATLTSHQAAVVKRRVDTLNATIRKKQKQSNKTDVRDIFKTKSWEGYGASPRHGSDEVDGIRGKNAERYSFTKNKGGYSMSGRKTENVADKMATGVEVLSMQPRGTFRQTSFTKTSLSHPMPSISDEDVSLDIKISEPTVPKERAPVHIMERKELRDNLPDFDIQPRPNGEYAHKRSESDHGLFGVPLETLLENDKQIDSKCTIPLVFLDIILFLEKHCLDIEGILRVPGSTSRVKLLRQEIEEKFYQGTFSWVDVMPNDAAALLKQFLRELPSPLLTPQYIEAFAQVENIPDRQLQLQALNLLIILLPDVNRNTLWVLLKFLNKIVSHRDQNLMGLNNVAMIIAPNLFLSPISRSKTKTVNDLEINMAAGTSNVVRMFIKYQKIIWMVPSFLLQQMRHKNELEQHRKAREKHKMKFLGKKDKHDRSELYKKPILHEGDFVDGVIRVQAPHLTKSCVAIRLDPGVRAGDIVNRFRKTTNLNREHLSAGKKSGRGKIVVDPSNVQFAQDNTHLFEVGGNIGERCLDHNTHMLTVYKVNPNAEWIIKGRGQP